MCSEERGERNEGKSGSGFARIVARRIRTQKQEPNMIKWIFLPIPLEMAEIRRDPAGCL